MLNKETNTSNCMCSSNQGLFINNKQLSYLVACAVMLVFCLFCAGYFLGQKNATVLFSNKIEQESFGDQIYSSMCALCETGEVEQETEQEETNQADQPALQADNQKNISENQCVHIPYIVGYNPDTAQDQEHKQAESDNVDVETIPQYYAKLVGFGSERNAKQFAQRLSRKEIYVIVKKRQSRTTKGRFIAWYQVITEKYSDRAELESLITRLKNDEKLNDVQIVSC